MTVKPRAGSVLRWTSTKNLLATLLFAVVVTVLEYMAVSFAASTGIKNPDGIAFMSIVISPLYVLVPIAVVVAVTASFAHLTTSTVTLKRRPETVRKQVSRKAIRRRFRLDSVRRFSRRLGQASRRIRSKIRKTWGIRQVVDRVDSARSVIGYAFAVIATFTSLVLLVTAAAYPKLVPSTAAGFFQGNPGFLGFVTSTIRAAQGISSAIPPIGAIAAAIHNPLIAVAPGFRSTLIAFFSPLSNGLASLSPIAKFLVAQNAAAWSAAIVAVFYRYYIRRRSYSR